MSKMAERTRAPVKIKKVNVIIRSIVGIKVALGRKRSLTAPICCKKGWHANELYGRGVYPGCIQQKNVVAPTELARVYDPPIPTVGVPGGRQAACGQRIFHDHYIFFHHPPQAFVFAHINEAVVQPVGDHIKTAAISIYDRFMKQII